MISWIDIACIVYVCVTANHLGLISAIERRMGIRLIVLNCPKCASFWLTVIYGMGKMGFLFSHLIPLLTISFLSSYFAIWLELFEGFVDTLYMKCYEKIYSNPEDDTVAADADAGHSAGTLSDM